MNKLMKILLTILVSVLTIVIALNIMALTVKNGLTEKKESQHFILFCSSKDKNTLSYLSNILEMDYERISANLQTDFKEKIVIRIFPNPSCYRMSFGNPLPWPRKVGGNAGKRSITIVSEKYLYPMNISNLLAHEMTHLLKDQINSTIKGGWLSEGIATYEGGDRPAFWIRSKIKYDIENGRIPTIDELNGCTYQEFTNKKGYEFSTIIVKFIVEEYGYDKVISLIKYNEDFMSVFNLTKDEFYKRWVSWIKEKY